MKNISTLIAVLFVAFAFGQNEETVLVKEEIVKAQKSKDILRHGPDIVHDIKIQECWAAPPWPETEIIQPTLVNEQPNGTMPLSKNLPFVHTIRGAVYTYEHLKYSVR